MPSFPYGAHPRDFSLSDQLISLCSSSLIVLSIVISIETICSYWPTLKHSLASIDDYRTITVPCFSFLNHRFIWSLITSGLCIFLSSSLGWISHGCASSITTESLDQLHFASASTLLSSIRTSISLDFAILC